MTPLVLFITQPQGPGYAIMEVSKQYLANSINEHNVGLREVKCFVKSKSSQSVLPCPAVAAAPGLHLSVFWWEILASDSKSEPRIRIQQQWIHEPGPVKPSSVFVCADCGHQNGGLQCTCEDGYTWFPPACLDPQKCYLHMVGPLQTCDCHLKNLTGSVNFCERTSKFIRVPGRSPWQGSLPPPHVIERELYIALCPRVSLCPQAELVFAGRLKDTEDTQFGWTEGELLWCRKFRNASWYLGTTSTLLQLSSANISFFGDLTRFTEIPSRGTAWVNTIFLPPFFSPFSPTSIFKKEKSRGMRARRNA